MLLSHLLLQKLHLLLLLQLQLQHLLLGLHQMLHLLLGHLSHVRQLLFGGTLVDSRRLAASDRGPLARMLQANFRLEHGGLDADAVDN